MATTSNNNPVSNPPDPQVPATPSEVTSGFYDNTPVIIETDPAILVPIEGTISLDLINLDPSLVNPDADPEVPQLPSEVASGFYDNTPVNADDNPLIQLPDTTVSFSEINTDPTAIDPNTDPDTPLPDTFDVTRYLNTAAEVDPAENPQVEAPADNIVSFTEEIPAPIPVDPTEEYAVYEQLANQQTEQPAASEIRYSAAELDALAAANGVDQGDGGVISDQFLFTNEEEASRIAAGTQLARQQSAISAQRGQQQQNDWRVRLQLAPAANYLYKAAQPGILQPLVATDGIIFPYTPKIDMSYKASYSSYELTHSNYKGYFYQNSAPGDVTITAHFTAQDTAQANYVLAVIHFFRSATKMFYGQDAQRGSPPPLVFLSGLGQFQFNQHPCLISEFTYSLPDEVDYIRAQTTNQAGLNLTSANSVKQSVSTSTIFSSIQRLANAFTTKGALPTTPFGSKSSPNLAQGSPTYVPTKIDLTIRLLPVNTRSQVSQQFSVKGFANGDLLKGGFW